MGAMDVVELEDRAYIASTFVHNFIAVTEQQYEQQYGCWFLFRDKRLIGLLVAEVAPVSDDWDGVETAVVEKVVEYQANYVVLVVAEREEAQVKWVFQAVDLTGHQLSFVEMHKNEGERWAWKSEPIVNKLLFPQWMQMVLETYMLTRARQHQHKMLLHGAIDPSLN